MDMESIDFRILGACNELMDLKTGTTKLRVENKNERGRLKRELDQRKLELENRLRSLRLTKDLSAYREACDQVFDEAGVNVPGLAAARQAQLCLHVHIMTMMENQLELAREQYAKEISYLETELNKVRESIMESEVSLLNEIVRLNQENREFREWMDRPIYIRKKKKKEQPPLPSLEEQQQPAFDSKGRPRVRFAQELEQPEPPAAAASSEISASVVPGKRQGGSGSGGLGSLKMTVPSRPEFLVASS